MQAPVLAKYPASISVTAYSYFFGALFMVVTAFFVTNESTDWNLSQSEAFAVCYAVSLFSSILIFSCLDKETCYKILSSIKAASPISFCREL